MMNDDMLVKCVHTPGLYPPREVILRQLGRPVSGRRAAPVRVTGRVRCVICGAPVGRCEMMNSVKGGSHE